jgi:AcrR family transcriptional regulator
MTGLSDDPELQAVLELFEAAHFDETHDPGDGLRERKKRQVRQRISNVATALFLVHGFDNVTVAQVAATAEVSEQTVFNYFSTKESLFFDRSEPMIRNVADAVGERRDTPLIEVAVQAIAGQIHPGRWANLDDAGQLLLIRRFCEVATGSPTLVAARFADLQRFVDEVSVALARRVGRDPSDAEVHLATFVIAGLVAVRVQSAYHHAQLATSFVELNDRIQRDFLDAARIAEPSLTAFDESDAPARG